MTRHRCLPLLVALRDNTLEAHRLEELALELGNRAQVSKLPSHAWMHADEVVEASIAACERGDPVYVTGKVNQAVVSLARLLPHRLAMMVMARQSARIPAQE